jgi:hypothetical protein
MRTPLNAILLLVEMVGRLSGLNMKRHAVASLRVGYSLSRNPNGCALFFSDARYGLRLIVSYLVLAHRKVRAK